MSPSAIAALAFVLAGAFFALGKKNNRSGSEFALAGRTLSGPALFATLAASNLSAFTVFGVSGAAYRVGWAFFPVMAFGTGFMALSFAYLGVPLRRLSAKHGWVTPGDFIGQRLGSRPLGRLFSGLTLAYTVPYLAIQAGAGGRLLASATGMAPALGSAFLTGVVALYVLRGGMRAVARTDILQLATLIGLGLVAAMLIASAAGRSEALAAVASDLAAGARAGSDGSLPWIGLAGYYALWSLADPMFPHFIQRFYAARSDRALLAGMAAYPLVALVVFFPMTAIGVMGRTMAPGLVGAEADGIFTILAERVAGPMWGPVFAVAALAALMSTMDSQLLSCASIVSGDLLPAGRSTPRTTVIAGIGLAILAWIVSLRPPEAMLSFLNRAAFPGYATLAPVALAGIYVPGVGAGGAVVALAAGAALVAFEAAGAIRPAVPAVFLNLSVQVAILALAFGFNRIAKRSPSTLPERSILRWPWIAVFAGFVAAATDVWNFRSGTGYFAGLPAWLWYQAGVTIALGVGFALLARNVSGTRGRNVLG